MEAPKRNAFGIIQLWVTTVRRPEAIRRDIAVRKNRRKYPQDALRWLMGVFVSAVIASAVTSAVFLTARPQPPAIEPRDQQLQTAREIAQALLPELESTARQHLQDAKQSPAPRVHVTFRTDPPEPEVEVPMVAPEEKMLTIGGPVPWQLEVVTTSGERKLGRVVDIRDTGSVTNPGYLGIVEVAVETSTRQLAVSGELPFEEPDGFQRITPAEYTELEGNEQFNVELASSESEQWEYTFENWAPATPPPKELPAEVRRQFNEAIVQCTTGTPALRVDAERLTFFYSLRERKWMPRQ